MECPRNSPVEPDGENCSKQTDSYHDGRTDFDSLLNPRVISIMMSGAGIIAGRTTMQDDGARVMGSCIGYPCEQMMGYSAHELPFVTERGAGGGLDGECYRKQAIFDSARHTPSLCFPSRTSE